MAFEHTKPHEVTHLAFAIYCYHHDNYYYGGFQEALMIRHAICVYKKYSMLTLRLGLKLKRPNKNDQETKKVFSIQRNPALKLLHCIVDIFEI